MSEEDTFWIKFGERFFGLILLIVGAILLYFTVTSLAELEAFSVLFGFLAIVIIALGVVLMIFKPPE